MMSITNIWNSINKLELIKVIILVIIFGIMFFCVIFKMNYFNITRIIKEYFMLFRENVGGKNRYNKGALCLAFVVPLLLSIFVYLEKSNQFLDVTLIISVLTAMLFAILGVIFSISDKIQNKDRSASEVQRLKSILKSVAQTDLFEILISVLILLLCFFSSFIDNNSRVIIFIINYLVFVLSINLLMLLKRLYIIINELIQK